MGNNFDTPSYAGFAVPPGSSIPTSAEAESCRQMLMTHYRIWKPAISGTEFVEIEILLPSSNYSMRLVPSSLEFREIEDGYPDASIVDSFFESREKSKLFYWNSFLLNDIDIIFIDFYFKRNREWMMNSRIKNNIGITSVDKSISISSDIFFGYSIISGRDEEMNVFDRKWGGRDSLRKVFIEYVESIPNLEKRIWMEKALIPIA